MTVSAEDLTQIEKHLQAEFLVVRKSTFIAILATAGFTSIGGALVSTYAYVNSTAAKVAKHEIAEIRGKVISYWSEIQDSGTLDADITINGHLTVNAPPSDVPNSPTVRVNGLLHVGPIDPSDPYSSLSQDKIEFRAAGHGVIDHFPK